jgi:hypothetical protein
MLAQFDLVQIRRDIAVNGANIRRLIGSGRHRLIVVLDDGARISAGREFQRQIRARFIGLRPEETHSGLVPETIREPPFPRP